MDSHERMAHASCRFVMRATSKTQEIEVSVSWGRGEPIRELSMKSGYLWNGCQQGVLHFYDDIARSLVAGQAHL